MFSGLFRSGEKKPLLRIDDRLIHGQVIVGWGERLGFHYMVLAHDASVRDEAVRELYNTIIPPEIEGSIRTLDETIEFFQQNPLRSKTLIIVESSKDALYLLQHGLEVEAVILGGLHHRAGCQELLSYVFLDRQRSEEIRAIIALGVRVYCQDLPDSVSLQITEKTLNFEF